MNLIINDKENRYRLYQLSFDESEMVSECEHAMQRFRNYFGDSNSTWKFDVYNTFCLSAGLDNFTFLYKNLISIIKDYHNKDEPLWFQSWINYHMPNEVLNWHNHYHSSYHGYVSIRPQYTKTVFRDYEIVNQVGLLYIGDSDREHKVQILAPYDEPRITIAFDVFTKENLKAVLDKHNTNVNLSFIPIY